jgi:23S rRNA (adenine2503-C2)-methyltransferase
MNTLIDIKNLNLVDLQTELAHLGEPGFRAKQIYQWLHQHQVTDFGEMTNLSHNLRLQLSDKFTLNQTRIASEQRSNDGSIKFLFELHDGHLVEGVLIPTENRMTACVSSQVGCSLSCKFCATGYLPMKRNLLAYEIVDQVVAIRKAAEDNYQLPLTNIVYMGMGEPLLNYKNVLGSIHTLTHPNGLGIAAKRITVSTAGIAKMIKKLGDDNIKFEFALSLHAANDEKRNHIMSINETNSLDALTEALIYLYDRTHARITFEYIVFDGFNDEIIDAQELLYFSRAIPCRINIIEYNPIAEADFRNTSNNKMFRFKDFLESNGATVTIRRSRGKDIDGACGQLAYKQH